MYGFGNDWAHYKGREISMINMYIQVCVYSLKIHTSICIAKLSL